MAWNCLELAAELQIQRYAVVIWCAPLSLKLTKLPTDMAEIGKKLSQRLRDPQGEHKCDLVIALTHSR